LFGTEGLKAKTFVQHPKSFEISFDLVDGSVYEIDQSIVEQKVEEAVQGQGKCESSLEAKNFPEASCTEASHLCNQSRG
jgi:hypothetical protein